MTEAETTTRILAVSQAIKPTLTPTRPTTPLVVHMMRAWTAWAKWRGIRMDYQP